MTQNIRNYGIDILKIISMFMVLLLHIIGDGGILPKTTLFTANDSIANILEILSYCAVDIFVICTGYL
ncbi:MAG: acyltransferase, partial [Armatimonadetes bacterium]|nr:acyltransferase [Candidatus Hippobium faecium]